MATDQNAAQVAQEQLAEWVETQEQVTPPVSARQTLAEADSRFCTPMFIYPLVKGKGMNVVVWVRSNRLFFCPPPEADVPTRWHPRWYGKRFILSDSTTWLAADKEESWETTHQGRSWVFQLQTWQDADAGKPAVANARLSLHPDAGLDYHFEGGDGLFPTALAGVSVPARRKGPSGKWCGRTSSAPTKSTVTAS